MWRDRSSVNLHYGTLFFQRWDGLLWVPEVCLSRLVKCFGVGLRHIFGRRPNTRAAKPWTIVEALAPKTFPECNSKNTSTQSFVQHFNKKWPIFYIAKIQCYVSCWKVDSSDSMEMSKSFWPLVIISVMPLVACRLSCIFCTCAWRCVSASWTSVSCWVSGMPLVCLSPVKIISWSETPVAFDLRKPPGWKSCD